METRRSIWSGVIDAFLQGKLAILLMIVSLLAGAAALIATPREEEPQIVVPLADVLVRYPGGSAEEVEKLVSSRLERLLSQIDGVEYVYSMSQPGQAVVTVRFFVGEDREESLIKLYNKVFQNIDQTTPGIAGWVIKPVEIDDVPIVTATLHSRREDGHALYRIAEEVAARLQRIPDSARVTIHGGQRRVLRVELDLERIAGHALSPIDVAAAIQLSNRQLDAGDFAQADRVIRVESGPFLRTAEEVRGLVVGLHRGRPVYLRDVAQVMDGGEEVVSHTRFAAGPAGTADSIAIGESRPAVTLAVAKKKGRNAVLVAREVEEQLAGLRGTVLPDSVDVAITRNYGETADQKVNELVQGLGEAIITVIVLITLMMNWRVGLIVAIAVPITYGLTLLVNLLLGYTINRVTLFALILTLGLLVDDPIVGVENIYRHLGLKRQSKQGAISTAMNEVLPPIVIATLAIVVAFLPMFFITGMMGPYMRPMAVNVPIAMLASMLVSLTITPWLSSKLLRSDADAHTEPDTTSTRTYRAYRWIMAPLVDSRRKSAALLWITAGLFGVSLLLIVTGAVPLKMLPFDNKNELQLVIDLPESATLERTDAVVRDLERFLATVPEVVQYTSYAGAASPMDFNGLVRHYYLRQGPHLADIRINLLPKEHRSMNSHAIALRIRREVEAIAARHDAVIRIVESPPGPPVLSTVVAEVYGAPQHSYSNLQSSAETIAAAMRAVEGVVEVDTTVESPPARLFFRTDREKAALNGIATDDITRTLRLALAGEDAGLLHSDVDQNEIPIRIRLPESVRSDAARLSMLPLQGRTGNRVTLGELGRFEEAVAGATIYHKNQERVVFVQAEMAGRGPAYAVLDLQRHFKTHPLPEGIRVDWKGEGEWKITVDVFRDLGIAFAVALLGIFVLLVYETGSYSLPGIIMLSIPLTMIGIMPGFSLLNWIGNHPVDGWADPVFFTATAMIGMIALAGVVVRNGVLLIDFIKTAVAQGRPLRESILESGTVRLRPIVLTAGTSMLGAWPITLDPIFSGLAWSLIFGLFVSTAFTLVVIPVVYARLYGREKTQEECT